MHVLHSVSNVPRCKSQERKRQGKFFSDRESAQKDGQLGTTVYGHARGKCVRTPNKV